MQEKYLQIQLLQGLDPQKIALLKQSIWQDSEQKDISVHKLCSEAKHSNSVARRKSRQLEWSL